MNITSVILALFGVAFASKAEQRSAFSKEIKWADKTWVLNFNIPDEVNRMSLFIQILKHCIVAFIVRSFVAVEECPRPLLVPESLRNFFTEFYCWELPAFLIIKIFILFLFSTYFGRIWLRRGQLGLSAVDFFGGKGWVCIKIMLIIDLTGQNITVPAKLRL